MNMKRNLKNMKFVVVQFAFRLEEEAAFNGGIKALFEESPGDFFVIHLFDKVQNFA